MSSTFADLHAQIDPHGAGTSYYFQYGPTAGYGNTVPVLTETSPYGTNIGAGGETGSTTETVTQHIGSLTPGTEYHYRIVAGNECEPENPGYRCLETSKDQTLTTLPETQLGLPDNRAYELVTPPNKQGGSDMFAEPLNNGKFFNNDLGVPALMGGGFRFETVSTFGAHPFAFGAQYLFRREARQSRWGVTSLAIQELSDQQPVGQVLFDRTGLSLVAFNDGVGTESGEEGSRLMNLVGPAGAQHLCKGAVTPQTAVAEDCDVKLHEDAPVHHLGEGTDTEIVGASNDLSYVVLASADSATCGGEALAKEVKHGHVLCEWSGGYEAGEGGEASPNWCR